MTDLYFLDANFKICGIISEYIKVIWNRRYFGIGSFTAFLPPSQFGLASRAKYIYHPINDEIALIERIENELEDDGKRVLKLSGRMIEAILGDRVIECVRMLEGTVSEVASDLVSEFCVPGARRIDRLSVGSGAECEEEIAMQVTGKNLMSFLYGLLSRYGLSFTVKYNKSTDKLVFSVTEGKDRSRTQFENSSALFSRDLDNILSDSYVFDISDYRNYAFVAGEGEGLNRFTAEVDLVRQGEGRKELYVDARDVRKTLDSGRVLTESEYRASLAARGKEKLKAHGKVNHAECEIDAYSNLVYRLDFDLGDICDFDDSELGVFETLRIVGITETHGEGYMNVKAEFGKLTLN